VPDLILALDQGTTSTRAIAFRAPSLVPVAIARRELPQSYPQPGWVEHDPETICRDSVAVLREALAAAGGRPSDVAAIGITNQRETTLLWDRASGAPVAPAIVWQDRRTAEACGALSDAGHEPLIAARTGLLLDPYFSATKLAWLLDNVPNARARAEQGDLAFGTVDTFLLWRLTGGAVHATDATNASRTALYDITRGDWDDDLLRLFRIPRALLPEVRDSAGPFGHAVADVLGEPVAIAGVAGDQQAATIGQACFIPGMVKATYGTGAFVLLNTGEMPVLSRRRLLTTIAWQRNGRRTYALEGAIFTAGATVQWLRDALGLIAEATESGALAARADPAERVYLVPAFTGLGAPWWTPDTRAAVFGLTRASGRAELARAALESVAFQTRDLLDAMRADWAEAQDDPERSSGAGQSFHPQSRSAATILRVDGGMSASDWTMQSLADQLAAPVDRPEVVETTALGAAYLAGWAAGVCPEPAAFAGTWRLDRRFTPAMASDEREERYAGWRAAVGRVVGPA
jgi:glycerol kinase